MPGPEHRPGQTPRPKAPPPRPSGSKSSPLVSGVPPRTHTAWTRFNGSFVTTLPSALRQARILRNAALKYL